MHCIMSYRSCMNHPLITLSPTSSPSSNVLILSSSKSGNFQTSSSMLLPRGWPYYRSIFLMQNKLESCYSSSRYLASIRPQDHRCSRRTKMRSAAASATPQVSTEPISTTPLWQTQVRPMPSSSSCIPTTSTKPHQAQ